MNAGHRGRFGWAWGVVALVMGLAAGVLAARLGPEGPLLFGIRAEFVVFALTLTGVAVFHQHTLAVAAVGLAMVLLLKLAFVPGFRWFDHLLHESPILLNLLGLLLGFALLAHHFEQSRLPRVLPRLLPAGWQGALALLAVVFVLSAFLDNIAAAMIGGTVASVVFRRRVHIGYLAALVAASNAGGAGSVLGDTTTTMMWIDGVAALDVAHAYVAAVPCLLLAGVPAAWQQHHYQPLQKDETERHPLDWGRLAVVGLVLVGALAANVLLDFPAVGVWAALLIGAFWCEPEWGALRAAWAGSLFLVCLVLCASMMPVDQLPSPSPWTAFGLGFVSAVFDNIPLTKLALDQGGYDWGVLAFAVGYGGSMLWFGSSAGVALSGLFPQARSVASWLRHGWPVAVAYVLSFLILVTLWGWHPPAAH
jgi:Na+/H+ antiporter NhaD/arsenite permease-like protein